MNTLFLPELREMLDENDTAGLREFCTALHPARTAEFMEGLDTAQAWQVLQNADPALQAEIFLYFEHDRQVELLDTQDEIQVAKLVTHLPADDVVDLFQHLETHRVDQILALVPAPDRRDIRKLQTFAEGTAGALMTTEAACVSESLSVKQALDQLSKQAERLETIHYIYVIDSTNHLRGIVSARDLVSSMGRPDTKMVDLMQTDLVKASVDDDQENVAEKVAFYDLSAIPVVDNDGHFVGIITHDDVIDVMRKEAAEDVQRISAMDPLTDSYMRTPILTLARKRGMWLTVLFLAGLMTAFALQYYQADIEKFEWLVWFLPLIISSGGNSGSQSATLVITGLATREIVFGDLFSILKREAATGVLLGGLLGTIGYTTALLLAPTPYAALVIPITILCVVLTGTAIGSMLPLILQKFNMDPALMSNPLVAALSDIIGIVIYLNVSIIMLT